MKNSMFSLAILSLLFTAAQALAGTPAPKPGGGGAGDGGGGSLTQPTASEIKGALELLSGDLEWAYWTLLMPREEGFPEDAFNNFLVELNYYAYNRMKIGTDKSRYKGPLKIVFNETTACPSINGDQEASVKLCDQEAPICFSIPEIQKRTPRATLSASLKALIMHEVAHQNCADEPLAKRVEDFFSSRTSQDIFLLRSMSTVNQNLTTDLETLFSFVGEGRNKRQPDTVVCSIIGRMNGAILSWELMLEATDIYGSAHTNLQGIPEESLAALRNDTGKLMEFCAIQNPYGDDEVKKVHGDRVYLERILKTMASRHPKVVQALTRSLGIYFSPFSMPK